MIFMIEFKVKISDTDYEGLASIMIPMMIKNKLLSKTVLTALKLKIKMTEPDMRDAVLAEFLNDHKDLVIRSLSAKLEKNGIEANIDDFSARSSI